MAVGAIVVDCNFFYEKRISVDDGVVIFGSDETGKLEDLSRENSLAPLWDGLDGLTFLTKVHLSTANVIRTWNWPVILNLGGEVKKVCFVSRLFDRHIAVLAGPEVNNYALYPNVWPIGRDISVMGNLGLASSDTRICGESEYGSNFEPELRSMRLVLHIFPKWSKSLLKFFEVILSFLSMFACIVLALTYFHIRVPRSNSGTEAFWSGVIGLGLLFIGVIFCVCGIYAAWFAI
jgi:hypothetical protein